MKEVLYVGSDCCDEFIGHLESEHDLNLVVANTGKEGIEQSTRPFDLVILSICIPDMSSWKLVRTLHRRFSSPIVLVGGIPISEDREKVLEAEGFSEYILGLRGKELFQRIKELLA